MFQTAGVPGTEELQRRMAQDEADFRAELAGYGFSEEETAGLKERIDAGEPLYAILGVPESDVRERYDLARRLYEAGRLTEAEALFRWLCLYSGSAPVNWMGLGAVLQCREQWEDALNAYGMAVQYTEGEEPAPWYHCGICSMQLGRREEATSAFREAILRCRPGAPGHGEVLSRAAALYGSLEEKEAGHVANQ